MCNTFFDINKHVTVIFIQLNKFCTVKKLVWLVWHDQELVKKGGNAFNYEKMFHFKNLYEKLNLWEQ